MHTHLHFKQLLEESVYRDNGREHTKSNIHPVHPEYGHCFAVVDVSLTRALGVPVDRVGAWQPW